MDDQLRGTVLEDNQMHRATGEFDINRASLKDKDLFEPFCVKETLLLREVLAKGEVHEDTPILLMESSGGSLALLTHQMTYHHVAQGELAGWPWLASF